MITSNQYITDINKLISSGKKEISISGIDNAARSYLAAGLLLEQGAVSEICARANSMAKTCDRVCNG